MRGSTDAYLYLRKSRDKAELADPDLLHKHRRELLRLAESAGHAVSPERVYQEVGSGDTLRARPDCRRLLEDLDRLPRGAGGNLWTTEVSRLTRGSLSDRARVAGALSRAAIVHCTRSGNYDLTRTNDRLQWEILTTMSAHELGQYKDRVAAAHVELTLEGRPRNGAVPWGWVWDRNLRHPDGSKGGAVPHPSRFPIVQAILAEALHLSAKALGEKYGLTGYAVHYLLRDPFVCGWPAKRFFAHKGGRVRRDSGEEWINPSEKRPPDQWLWPRQAGHYQPACTREHWEAVQRAIDSRRDRRAKTGAVDGWCRSVVRFAGYDRPASLASQNGPGRDRILTYELSRRADDGTRGIYIYRHVVHERALAALRSVLCQPEALKRGVDAYNASRRPDRAPDASALESEIARTERLLDALLDRELRAADAGDTREAASVIRQREQYKRELSAADAALKTLVAQRGADPAVEDLLALLSAFDPADLPDLWETFSDLDRQRVVTGLIEEIRCRVERPGGSYRWRREVEEVRVREFLRPYITP